MSILFKTAPGNHEDGALFGLDSLIDAWDQVAARMTPPERLTEQDGTNPNPDTQAPTPKNGAVNKEEQLNKAPVDGASPTSRRKFLDIWM